MTTEVTIEQFANAVGIPVDRLLSQLHEAGLGATAGSDRISDEEKVRLLAHLRKSHGRKETLAVSEPQRITLRRKSHSQLRMAGAQGRVKTVSVEVRKKRTYVKRSVMLEQEAKRRDSDETVMEARAKLKEVEAAETLEQVDPELAARQEEERQAAARVEQAAREEAERVAHAEAERLASAEVERLAREQADAAVKAETEQKDRERVARETQERERAEKERRGSPPGPGREKADRRKLEREHRVKEKAARARKSKRSKVAVPQPQTRHGFTKPMAPVVHEVVLPETISVGELAQKMSVKATEVIKTLMKMGTMVTINQALDQDTAALVVEVMGHQFTMHKESAVEDQVAAEVEVVGDEVARAPVVTIMGHVDHGKTSLLDHIRSTRVAAGETGGITQHIGAYHVETDKGMVTFLDTPGHAAFTAMRARGAKSTDIVVLVVAADDGVMPQTREAIQHAKAAGAPLIVAINKIDKADADLDRVKTDLSQHEVIPEDWGGDTMCVPVSAKTGEGVDTLLDSILLQAEIMELRTVADGPARGVVLESRLDKGRGSVATVLVQRGTLEKGDVLLAGLHYGRVRALLDETGASVKQAGPSIPVEVLGLSGTPLAGDEAVVVADERKAREVALLRQGKSREVKLARQQKAKLDNLFEQMSEGETQTLNVVLKADVQGSVEALGDALEQLSMDEVQVNIVASGVGGITESDANLAVASNAIVIGFNVRADAVARKVIAEEEIDLHYYGVIYEAIDEVKRALQGMLAPEFKEQIIGLAEVRDVFRAPKIGAVAGCMVVEGVVKRNRPIRVLRDHVVIYEGELESLRRFKDDASEVRNGLECGIGVKNYNDVKIGDQIEVFEKVEVPRAL
jgi:translation initiation factor IF-2